MAIDLDDEIVQDFLVEAGEILEKLNGQLVELEQAPDDYDLLNAIFRGFHTIKGGAGFLNLTALIEVCHRSEDIFNLLRQGARRVDAGLMDVILEVLDVVNLMFQEIASGRDPSHAEAGLLQRLEALTHTTRNESPGETDEEELEYEPKTVFEDKPETIAQPTGRSVVEEVFTTMLESAEPEVAIDVPEILPAMGEEPGNSSDDITEEEFERLLDALHGEGKHIGQPSSSVEEKAVQPDSEAIYTSDDITEEEFESLLDSLHGKGKHRTPASETGSSPREASIPEYSTNTDKPTPPVTSAGSPVAKDKGGEITEDEFESLLDSLHGKGKHQGAPSAAKPFEPEEMELPPSIRKKSVPNTPPLSPPVDKTGEDVPSPRNVPHPAANRQSATPAAETTVRVDTQRLDEIMNLVGELVLVRNRFQTLRIALNDEEIAKAVANLDVVTSDLQISVMKTRMQPIKKVFGRFPRVVRDLARSLSKDVQLELRGEDTDLDKNLVEALADPLVHLVRNAVDHGIETQEERSTYGKARQGLVILTAAQEGNHIELTIEDDGRGMDPAVLKRKAVEKGLMDQDSANRMDDKEAFNLIFMPGFSTKTEISDVSGRGVGMDVVKTRIAQMNGSVAIESVRGKGSKITIKLPLTLAIMPTLMVKLNEQPFALPLASVVEILDLDLNKTNMVDGQLVVMVRQRALPLFYLKEWLVPGFYHEKKGDEMIGHVVVVNAGGRQIGFVVDHLVGQEEVVIKPLGVKLQGVAGMAGATITGDGKIALILDVPGLMKRYAP
ncbi:MAG: chemotaxis protein CheA [Methylococcaceae bacterium]